MDLYETPMELKRQGRLPKGWHDPEKVKITHKFMDGTERDTLEGYTLPDNEITRDFYRIAAMIIRNGSAINN